MQLNSALQLFSPSVGSLPSLPADYALLRQFSTHRDKTEALRSCDILFHLSPKLLCPLTSTAHMWCPQNKSDIPSTWHLKGMVMKFSGMNLGLQKHKRGLCVILQRNETILSVKNMCKWKGVNINACIWTWKEKILHREAWLLQSMGSQRVEHDSVAEQQQSNPQFIKGSFDVGKWVNCLELRMHSVTWKFESQRNPSKQACCSSLLQASRHCFSRNRWQSLFLGSDLEQDLFCWQVNWIKFSYWPPHLSFSASPSAAQSLPDPSRFHMDYSLRLQSFLNLSYFIHFPLYILTKLSFTH